jgi:hypothetical protein
MKSPSLPKLAPWWKAFPDLSLIVSEGQAIEVGQFLTSNPNVGGFGQKETEVVLQNPGTDQRIGLIPRWYYALSNPLSY